MIQKHHYEQEEIGTFLVLDLSAEIVSEHDCLKINLFVADSAYQLILIRVVCFKKR